MDQFSIINVDQFSVDIYNIPCEDYAIYEKRRLHCRPKKKLDNPILFNCVKDLFLNHQWSPEQISARLKYENSNFTISYNTI